MSRRSPPRLGGPTFPWLFAVAFGVPILKLRCLSSSYCLQVVEGLKPKNGARVGAGFGATAHVDGVGVRLGKWPGTRRSAEFLRIQLRVMPGAQRTRESETREPQCH
jgi:hypothetical protein